MNHGLAATDAVSSRVSNACVCYVCIESLAAKQFAVASTDYFSLLEDGDQTAINGR